MLSDARFAVRSLKREPGFVLVAVLTIALAVGCDDAPSSIAYAVLPKPLP